VKIWAGKISLHFWDYKINWFPLFLTFLLQKCTKWNFSVLLKTLKKFIKHVFISTVIKQKVFSTERGVNQIHKCGRVDIFFLSNFHQKKVKLSENLEKQFQNTYILEIDRPKIILNNFTVDFFSTILDFFGTHKKVVTLEHEFWFVFLGKTSIFGTYSQPLKPVV